MAEYHLAQENIGVSISADLVAVMAQHCDKSKLLETGGILIGYYTDNLKQAVVCTVTGPPPDSVHQRYSFKRGVKGLKQILAQAKKDDLYYIGEWHFHPKGSVDPSSQDISQMKEIAQTKSYNCPEPIMIIIAGDYIEYRIGVFIAKRKTMKLYELNMEPTD